MDLSCGIFIVVVWGAVHCKYVSFKLVVISPPGHTDPEYLPQTMIMPFSTTFVSGAQISDPVYVHRKSLRGQMFDVGARAGLRHGRGLMSLREGGSMKKA